MTRLTLTILLIICVLFGPLANADGHQEAGKAVVEKLHASLLAAMQNADNLGFQGRRDNLAPVVRESFDFSTIARIVTGSHWSKLSEEDKAAFIDVFAALSTATYASNFDGYSGEVFETAGVEEKRSNLLVHTAILKSDGERIPLDYLLRNDNGLWRIVNVIADGVSDLSLKRADYTAVIKSEGFDSLVGKLNGKIANYNSLGQ